MRRWLVAVVALLLVAAMLVCVPYAAEADGGEALIFGTMATDVAVTEVLRAQGYREANPMQQNRAVGYAIKGVVVVGVVSWRRHLIKTGHPRAAKWLTIGVVAVSGAAVGASLYRARRRRHV